MLETLILLVVWSLIFAGLLSVSDCASNIYGRKALAIDLYK